MMSSVSKLVCLMAQIKTMKSEIIRLITMCLFNSSGFPQTVNYAIVTLNMTMAIVANCFNLHSDDGPASFVGRLNNPCTYFDQFQNSRELPILTREIFGVFTFWI